MRVLAIDLGGTSAKIAIVENKEIKQRWTIPTVLGNIFKNIYDNLDGVNWDEIDAIGLSIPGFLDHEKSIIALAGNLKLKDFNAREEFKKIFGKDVYIVNDANAAALGELYVGAGRDYKSIIFYTIGTGVGGGIVVNGELVYGSMGYAGELGHGGLMQTTDYKCTCGLANCIEATSSATGIQKELVKKFGEGTKIIDVADRFKNGDEEVIEVFRRSLSPLASHIAVMETAINPEAIIIGGGPSALGQPLIDLIKDLVSKYQLDFIHNSTDYKIAETKNDAGIYGATYWSIKRHNKN